MIITELRQLLERTDLDRRERTAVKMALAFLTAEPPTRLTVEEYFELPRKFELMDGELILTY